MHRVTILKTQLRIVRASIMRGVATIVPAKSIHLSERVLIVAPHPDDETFGVGGFMASLAPQPKHPEGRTSVHVLFLTSGGKSHLGCCDLQSRELEMRREFAARRATHILGVDAAKLHFFRLADGGLPHSGGGGILRG